MSQIQKLGSLGAMGILVPSDYGGAGLDTAALSIAVQEISRYYICFCTSSTYNLRPVETIIRRFFILQRLRWHQCNSQHSQCPVRRPNQQIWKQRPKRKVPSKFCEWNTHRWLCLERIRFVLPFYFQSANQIHQTSGWDSKLSSFHHANDRHSNVASFVIYFIVSLLKIVASGSDAAGLQTTATATSCGFILNGTKAWVTNAKEAKAIIVFAVTNPQKRHRGISAFIVDIPSEGK